MKTPKLKPKRDGRVRSSNLVRRFSEKQAELAAKISNDIAEDIDCGESRRTLRIAVAYFADVACVESQRRAEAESTLKIFKSEKAPMDVVLPTNNNEQPESGAAVRSSALLGRFPRMEKDGKVAVLYSPGFGSGWSTWNDDEWKPLLTTHREIVQAVLDADKEKAGRLAEQLIREAIGKADAYVCVLGADDLEVKWLPKGCEFDIEEYDGSESIHVIGDRGYQTV